MKYCGIKLTENQIKLLKLLPDTTVWEGLHSKMPMDIIWDELSSEFQNKPTIFGALMSTLTKKGIISISKQKDQFKYVISYVELTPVGREIITLLIVGGIK